MNLVVEKYGVKLIRLTEDKIELVRQWRNDPKIQQYMEYREYITPEMQRKWFQSVSNDNNYYFIINYNVKDIGLVNVKNIDYQNKCTEGGIFIYDEKYLNGDISFRVCLCLYDFVFEDLKLLYTIAHVLRDNRRAIQFNKAFGAVLADGQENIINQLYTLEKNVYLTNREKIKKILHI